MHCAFADNPKLADAEHLINLTRSFVMQVRPKPDVGQVIKRCGAAAPKRTSAKARLPSMFVECPI